MRRGPISGAVRPGARALAWLALLFPLPAAATTYVMVPDGALADQASAIVEVRVEASTAAAGPGLPATAHTVVVERAVAGAVTGARLTVRVPGGVGADGVGRRIWGAPELAPGERALLFLAARGDGTYRILHLSLGAFRLAETGGRTVAARDLSGAHELRLDGGASGGTLEPPEITERPRDLERFARWLQDRRAGLRRAADYHVELPPAELARAAEKFTLLVHRPTGLPIRWFEFDSGGSVDFRAHQAGQPGVPGGGFDELQRALAAWNDDASTAVRYLFGGTTPATGGFSEADDVSAILFEDPNEDIEDDFSCETGGILAIGGPAFFPNNQGTFDGATYIRTLEADIVTNDGISCIFGGSSNPRRLAEELFTHELGHTLGLGHSCDEEAATAPPSCTPGSALDDATMRWSIHNDGRGATLRSDDRAGLRQLYQPGGGPPEPPSSVPSAPTDLAADALSPTEVRLTWTDTSDDETGLRVQQRAPDGSFTTVASLPVNATATTVGGLSPATAYTFRVRAVNGEGQSAPSNEVTVTTLPAAAVEPCVPGPTVLCLQGGRFAVQAQWETQQGTVGDGRAVPLTGDTGLFWFFQESNVEVVVKVLDACGDFGRFWVFAGGLTNVETVLTVTDTATGAVRTYTNPQGAAFRPLQDTDAFATCP